MTKKQMIDKMEGYPDDIEVNFVLFHNTGEQILLASNDKFCKAELVIFTPDGQRHMYDILAFGVKFPAGPSLTIHPEG